MAELKNILPVISFYDLHAADYNSRMSASDDNVRWAVRQYFSNYVQAGSVLDFGGGTGLDLLWLSEYYSQVIFIEPSMNMSAEAYKISEGRDNIIFVRGNIDFNKWDQDCMPFNGKVNGVMANFAVFNCIRNIDKLFEKLDLVCTSDGYIIAAVLNADLKSLLKNYSLKIALKSMLNRSIGIANNQKGVAHITYLHTKKQYKSASAKHFELIDYRPVANSNFAVIIFRKK
ncbi:MAG: methyltransferase domain-containing protein [Flavipsychrobacter sp.]